MLHGSPVITIKNPQGRWARGPSDTCPPDHCTDEQNLVFDEGQCGSRSGFESSLAAQGSWDGSVVRTHKYERIGEVLRYLILDSSGNIWDSSTDFSTAILTGVAEGDFACTSLFNRAYLCASTGLVGGTGDVVYVYDGTGTARAAAGTGVTAGTMAAADNVGGSKVELGDHLFAVACETASGFITIMGLTGSLYVKHTSPGGQSVDLTGIPLGPAGTVKRHLVATTTLSTDYNDNPAEQEWFFIPRSNIDDPTDMDDNVTQTATVDFYDADLLVQATYLQFQKATIPAGCHLNHFEGRLIVCGDASNDHIVLLSEPGKPESVSDLNGFVIVDPGDMGDGVKNAIEHRGLLYLTKTSRTYVTSDNGSAPATWQVNLVDANVGCEALGAGELLDVRGATKDVFLIAHLTGLFSFVGSYSEEQNLAWKVRDIWSTINPLYMRMTQVQVDPINQVIYIAAALDAATEPSHILICDYKQGLTPKTVRWSKWALHVKPTAIWTETKYTTKVGQLKFGSSEGDIFLYTAASRRDNAGATLIDAYARFGQVSFNNEGAVNHYNALRFRVRGYGLLEVTTYTLDDAVTSTPAGIILGTGPGKEVQEYINEESEELSVKIGTDSMFESNPSWFTLTHLRIAGKARWGSRPSN